MVNENIKGKLIVLTGPEGSGKSTCIEKLKNRLPSTEYVFTKEPYGKIRTMFLKDKLTLYEQLLAIELSRSIHFRKVVIPNLEKGINVICDRSYECTYGYQIVAGGASEKLCKLYNTLDRASRKDTPANLWIYFKIKPKVALERIRTRGKKLDNFEKQKLSYHKDVEAGIIDFIEHFKRAKYVDATQDADKLASDVYKIINDFVTPPGSENMSKLFLA